MTPTPRDQGTLDKLLAAERHVAWVRLGVIVLNIGAYVLLLDKAGTYPSLAYPVMGVALSYAVGVLAVKPVQRLAALGSSYFTTAADAALITVWIGATGGFESPFYLLWYVSLAAVAFRYDYRPTLAAAGLYAACYVGLLALMGELAGHAGDLAVRVGYIGFVGVLAAFLARESSAQARGRAEASRREVRFRALVEAAPDGIVIVDRDGRIVLVNSVAERLFGYRRDELVGKPVEILVPERLRGGHVAHRLRYASGPAVRPMGQGLELWARRKDGREVAVEISLSPVETEDGTLITSVVRDVTERRRAEVARSQLAAIVESSDDAILSKDLEGVIVTWNRGAEKTFGFTPEEAVGRRVTIIFPQDRFHEEDSILEHIRRGQVVEAYETVRQRKDGRLIDVAVKVSPIRDADGRVIGASSISRDITLQRRAEEERLAGEERVRELERLKELDRFKTQFINMAAHELGTPLTPIKLQVHLLKTARLAGLSEDQQKSVRILDRNVDRLAQLVQDVLEVTRLQAGRLGVRRQPLDLNRVVFEAVESFQEPARHAGVDLELQAQPGITLDGDAKRLTQVLFNLLSNALKFTPRGGRVTVSTALAGGTGGTATVRVRDTGSGLRPEDIPKLFQPFSQVHDTMQSNQPGTGLGLYICRGIVELHGGRIWAESAGPGKGSTFTVALPAGPPGLHPGPAAGPGAGATRPDVQADGKAPDTIARRARELV